MVRKALNVLSCEPLDCMEVFLRAVYEGVLKFKDLPAMEPHMHAAAQVRDADINANLSWCDHQTSKSRRNIRRILKS